MNEAQAFAAVVAAPNNLASRAAYADLVGGERADFIRAQLSSSSALRVQRPNAFDADAVLLAEELLAGREVEWAHGVDTLVTHFGYMRGFVELATVDAGWFTQHWQRLFERAPLRHLVVHGLAQAPAFFQCEGLRQMVGLTFNLFGTPAGGERLDDAGAHRLASSLHLEGLRYLDLGNCQLTDGGKVEVLRALPSLRACLMDELGETVQEDFDGSPLGVVESEGQVAFEAAYGRFDALHEVSRTGSPVLRERY